MKVEIIEALNFPPEIIFGILTDIPHHVDWVEEPVELVSLSDGPAKLGTKWEQNADRLGKKLVATGNLYLKLKLPAPARVYFQRAIDEYGDTEVLPRAQLGLALADARQGKRDQAVAALREIETQHPRLPVAKVAARERRRLEHQKH